MKRIKIITSSVELEEFVNRTNIEIIQVDIKSRGTEFLRTRVVYSSNFL